jgi:hypothetical protein
MRTRLLAVAVIGLTSAAIATPGASGDGGPNSGVVLAGKGIAVGSERYVTVPTVGWTAIMAINRKGGQVDRFTTLRGTWGIPVVAGDGTTDGLMSDGRTLLLGEATAGPYLRKHSSFAVVDMKKLRLMRTFRVRGHHVFDALSPDDRFLYLVEYISPQDFSLYRVRAYDLRAGKLLRKAVFDRREVGPVMHGYALTRASSSDGQWVYTLYTSEHHWFIHALDTKNVRAICIDMPWRHAPKRLWEFRLRVNGNNQVVVRGPRGRTLVAIDREQHRVVSFVPNL